MAIFDANKPSKPEGLPCPHEKIIELWHTKMPELQKIVKWTTPRKASLRSRWREVEQENKWTSVDEGSQWFNEFFDSIRQSSFLMGKSKAINGREPFALSLDWALKPTNFINIVEGKYHR